jgi:hypothetical protein
VEFRVAFYCIDNFLGGSIQNSFRGRAAVEFLQLGQLLPDFILRHGINRAVANLFSVDVNRPERLPASVLSLHGSTICASL